MHYLVTPFGLFVDICTGRSVEICNGKRTISLLETEWLQNSLFNVHADLETKTIDDKVAAELESLPDKTFKGSGNGTKAVVRRRLDVSGEDDDPEYTHITLALELKLPKIDATMESKSASAPAPAMEIV